MASTKFIAASILVVVLLAKGVGHPTPKLAQASQPSVAVANLHAAELKSYALQHGIEPRLVAAVIRTESNWNVNAKGTSGELGLMQLMPATAKYFKVKNRLDPIDNIKGGIRYLAYCKQKAGSAFLRCYNAGEAKTHLPQAFAYEKKVKLAFNALSSGRQF